MLKEFHFEDYSLILTQDCNFICKYCLLNRKKLSMSKDIVKIILDKIINFSAGYKVFITLFGGEPLLNKEVMLYIGEYFVDKEKELIKKNMVIELKLITNGYLIDEFIGTFNTLNNINNLIFLVDVSLDGKPNTMLLQRPHIDKVIYIERFEKNIELLNKNNIKYEFNMLLWFEKKDYIFDLIYMIKWFGKKIKLMTVELNKEYIKNNVNKENINNYLLNLIKLHKFIKKYKLEYYVANYSVGEFYDFKIVPYGPTFAPNGDIYLTRDFFMALDKDVKYKSIGNIDKMKMADLIEYIEKENSVTEATNNFYSSTMGINKGFGDLLTGLIYDDDKFFSMTSIIKCLNKIKQKS